MTSLQWLEKIMEVDRVGIGPPKVLGSWFVCDCFLFDRHILIYLKFQGIRAVLAESFERIHRSNLVGMGIIPLQFLPGQNADTYQLTGRERYTLNLDSEIEPGMEITVTVSLHNA